MFGLPPGEKVGIDDEVDLRLMTSEMPYGCISYYKPRARIPSAHRLIGDGAVIGTLCERDAKKRTYVGGDAAEKALKKLAREKKLRAVSQEWSQQEFAAVAIQLPMAFPDLSRLTGLAPKPSISSSLSSLHSMSFIRSLCERPQVLGALASQQGMAIFSDGSLPADAEKLSETAKKELDRTESFVKGMELPDLVRASLWLEDGALSMLRSDGVDFVIWIAEGTDHDALINDAIAGLDQLPLSLPEDDGGVQLEEGLVMLERKGGTDSLISMLTRGKSDGVDGYLRVAGDEGDVDVLLEGGIPCGCRAPDSADIGQMALSLTSSKAALSLHTLRKVPGLKAHLNTIGDFSLNLLCTSITTARTRSDERRQNLENRLLTLFGFAIGIEVLQQSLAKSTLQGRRTGPVTTLRPRAAGGEMLMPTSVVDSGEYEAVRKEQARLIKENARVRRRRDAMEASRNAVVAEVAELKERIGELQQLAVDQTTEVSELKIEMRESKNGEELAGARAEKLARRVKELEHQVEQRIEELGQAVGDAETRAGLKDAVRELAGEEVKLKSELEAGDIRLRQIRSSIDADDRRHRMISDQLQAQRDRQREATAVSAEMERRISIQEKELEDIGAEADAHRRLIEEEKIQFIDYERRLGHLQGEVRELMEERRRVLRELGDLGARRAESEVGVEKLIESAEALKSAHDAARADIAEAERIRARMREEPLAQALLGHDHVFESLAPVIQRLDRMRDMGYSMTMMDRAIERGLTIIQHNVEDVAKTPRYLLSNEVMQLLEQQAPATAGTVRGLTHWSVRQRLENKLSEVVQLVVLDLEALLEEFERSTTLLRRMRQMISQMGELGVPRVQLDELEALCNRPEALPHIADNLHRTIQTALESIYLHSDRGDAGEAVKMEQVSNALEDLMSQLDATGLTIHSQSPGPLWRFQQSGTLPHEKGQLATERPDVPSDALEALNPHLGKAADVEAAPAEVDAEGWTEVSTTEEQDEPEPISTEEPVASTTSEEWEDEMTRIDLDLARLDDAWGRRGSEEEVPEAEVIIDDSAIDDLNREFADLEL